MGTRFLRNNIQSYKHIKLLEDDVGVAPSFKFQQIPTASTPSRQLKDLWTTITFDDFESGWGNYESGGSYASIVTFHSRRGHSVRVRGGSIATEASFFHNNNHDVTLFNTLRIHFSFNALNVDSNENENLLLEYSSDGGENWNTIKIWKSFVLGVYHEETVLLTKGEVEFSNMVRLRFRC